jgi:hypothetical protein
MKLNTAIVSFCLIASGVASAQTAGGDEPSAMLYLESLAMSKRAPICASRMPEFANKFDPAFATWRQSNTDLLQKGEATLKAAAAAEKKDFNAFVGAVTDGSAHALQKATPSVAEESCNAMLKLVNTP